jgi:CrcB protein
MRTLYFLLGSGLGAVTRYLIDRYFRSHFTFPWGILLVNMFGSFLLGLIFEADSTLAFAGFGFCGALTTWSAFALDLENARRAGKTIQIFANILANFVFGVGALLLARTIAG